eukprot:g1991.t1
MVVAKILKSSCRLGILFSPLYGGPEHLPDHSILASSGNRPSLLVVNAMRQKHGNLRGTNRRVLAAQEAAAEEAARPDPAEDVVEDELRTSSAGRGASGNTDADSSFLDQSAGHFELHTDGESDEVEEDMIKGGAPATPTRKSTEPSSMVELENKKRAKIEEMKRPR